MPSERFFYRPVPPNFEAIGSGLGYGIERGVSNYLDERDRKRERERQKRLDAQAQAEFDIYLASLGGGRGAPPEQAPGPQLDFGKPGMAGNRGPGSILTRPPDLGGPQPPGPVQQAVNAPPRRQYQSVGPEGYEAYIEDPESMQRRRMMEEAALERRATMDAASAEDMARQQRIAGIGQALIGVRSSDPEARAAGSGYLMEGGYADYEDLYPTADPSKDRGLPTFSEAEEIVDSYSYYETPEGEPRDRLTPGQRLAAIRAIARGEPTGIEDLDSTMSWGERNQEIMGEMFGGGFNPLATPDTLSPLDPGFISAVRRELEGIPREQWEEALRANDFTEFEIQRILGR